jgi:hypothetical protein
MRLLLLGIIAAAASLADGPGIILSKRANTDFALTADPSARHWKEAEAVVAGNNSRAEAVPNHRTEIRSRWTSKNIYFLFVCPYDELNLRPNGTTTEETNKLWEWDVAEVFVGSDFDRIWKYKEFQVSPRGEWVDLDIDRKNPSQEGWKWNSGFEVKGRIDEARKTWYGEMRIPIETIDTRAPAEGLEMRINFYRLQGPGPQRKGIAWQPTNAPSYHVPEAFGRIKLVK